MSNHVTVSVDVRVSRRKAWAFWTQVENWKLDPAIESVRLSGPFASGTKGVTVLKSGAAVRWLIAEAEDGERAIIETPLADAVARFAWRFERCEDGVTRITQTIAVTGPAADVQSAWINEDFARGVQQGMRRLADAMEADGRSSTDG